MKDTFFNLNEEKQRRIMDAVLEEFAVSGYENTSLDMIVRRAGISKGGLYEYIVSKDGLFRYALEYAYSALDRYIREAAAKTEMPSDPIERTRCISSIAVDFYISQPKMISFIVRSSRVDRQDIRKQVESIFDSYFSELYGSCDFSSIPAGRDESLALIKWLLVKTRNDFSENMQSTSRPSLCREAYLAEWSFFLSVLSKGIYAE